MSNKGEMEMFCKTCGKEVNDNAVICPHCGCETCDKEKKENENKINAMCLVGFIVSLASIFIALYGATAVVGFIFSMVGVYQTNHTKEKFREMGIAGIVVSIISFVITLVLSVL